MADEAADLPALVNHAGRRAVRLLNLTHIRPHPNDDSGHRCICLQCTAADALVEGYAHALIELEQAMLDAKRWRVVAHALAGALHTLTSSSS
jgi:hypothetical protein